MRTNGLRAALLLFALTACPTPSPRVASAPSCGPGNQPAWASDSAVVLCLPEDFRSAPLTSATHTRWERSSGPDSARAWLSVSIDTSATPEEPWPPHIASAAGCVVDCTRADSIVPHRETILGSVVEVETGLATGGVAGLRRQPMLVAGSALGAYGRIWIHGYANSALALDSLRRLLPTIRVARMYAGVHD
jgi:hypothetical protein